MVEGTMLMPSTIDVCIGGR